MAYKLGDKIGKYTLTREFSTRNAGRCEWGYVTYNEQEFFIKRFLNPVYPGKDAPGSDKKNQEKRKRCDAFEARYKVIKESLSHFGEGGLIVQPVDFFKYGEDPSKSEHYFKVFHKVNTLYFAEDIHLLTEKDRLLIMASAAYTVSELHSQNIIHFDIKPDNILINKSWGSIVAKLIDFDDSIITESKIDHQDIDFDDIVIPESKINHEDIVGDFVYYSPELAKYIESKGTTIAPNFKSDVFALGLVFSQYWTGKLPKVNSDSTYPYQAVLNHEPIEIAQKSRLRISKSLNLSTGLSPEVAVIELIENMLSLSLEKRPTSKEVHERLKLILGKL